MAFRKFAKASILGVDTNRGMSKSAHRAHFEYEPRPGYIYVRCRAISSRTNDNFDNFPAEEIKLGYKSFEGKPVFINHQNTNHRRARGVILQAALHEDVLEDGTEDTWVELLQEIDATNFPLLAQAILDGEVDRTSMGCDITHSKCSACGNIAQTPAEYCSHIPNKKGQKIRRTASDGSVEDVLIYEVCSGLSFFENSILVEEPADPTAYFVDVDARGVGGGYRGNLTSLVDSDSGPRQASRYLADHHLAHSEASSDVSLSHLASLRPSLSTGGLREEISSDDDDVALGELRGRVAGSRKAPLPIDHVSGVLPVRSENPVSRVVAERHIASMSDDLPLRDWSDQLGETPSMRSDARSSLIRQSESSVSVREDSSSPHPTVIGSPREVDLAQVSGHLSVHSQDYTSGADPEGVIPTGFLGVDDRGIGGGYRGEVPVMASKSQKRRKQARRKKAAAMARTASKTAIGETKAPPRVDTLRDEKCPICAESDSFDGVECRVCGYTKPPDEFMDPNLDLAGEVDFRQEQSGDPGADVVVDEGGAEVEEDDASALIDGDVEGEDEDDLGEDDEDDEGQFSLQDAEEDSEDEEEVGPTLKGEQFTLTQPPDEDEEFEVEVDDEPDMSEEDESDDDSEDDEEEDPESDDEDDPKDKKKSSSRLAGQTLSGEGTHTMNALEALALQRNNKKLAARNAHLVRQARNQSLVIATQSEKLAAQGAAISRIAKKAGVDLSDIQRVERRKLASLRKRSDADNPAQPIPDGPTQAPSQTTEEARNPGGNSTGLSDSHGDGTMADVTQIGGDIDSSDPDVNTDLMEIGGIVGDELDLDEVDVTSPVEGTTDGAGQTETDGDVTAIDEVRPETAFPIESARKRTFSALKLARLRIEAGIAEGDDLVVGEKIASSKMTDREIAHEIGTIASVMNKGASREASRNLVPRSASRSVPSMGITANASAPAAIIAGSSRPVADSFLFD